jgi:hypothetical protein
MRKVLALAAGVLGASVLAGSAAVFGVRPVAVSVAMKPVWTEANWPFPIDQWGIGKAFVCAPSDCATGVADDDELERVGDTSLISPTVRAQGSGRPIKAGWMRGLSRSYWASDRDAGLLSIAYNDECDVVAAVATFGRGEPAAVERAVVTFLNSDPMVLWAKRELGLEFISRSW